MKVLEATTIVVQGLVLHRDSDVLRPQVSILQVERVVRSRGQILVEVFEPRVVLAGDIKVGHVSQDACGFIAAGGHFQNQCPLLMHGEVEASSSGSRSGLSSGLGSAP